MFPFPFVSSDLPNLPKKQKRAAAPLGATAHFPRLLALLAVLALLVGDAAAGLASGLAGGLALAAAAVLGAVAQVAGFNGLDMRHFGFLHIA